MKKFLTTEEKQEEVLKFLREHGTDFALFHLDRAVVKPLIKRGLIHADTYRFTGGARLTAKGRQSNLTEQLKS